MGPAGALGLQREPVKGMWSEGQEKRLARDDGECSAPKEFDRHSPLKLRQVQLGVLHGA